jgi:hypothetical protein
VRLRDVLLVLVVGSSVLSTAGCRRPKRQVVADQVPLDQAYTTRTRLLTLHYPKFYAATAAGEHSAALSPTSGAPVEIDSELYFTANMTPISNEVSEYARVIIDKLAENKPDYVEVYRRNAKCFRNMPGIEHLATFRSEARRMRRWSCTFLANGHGYSFGYFVAETATSDTPLLEKILQATEIRQ